MTKQELLDNRWKVYLNYEGPVPLPDHLADLPGQIQNDISSVSDATNLPQPDINAVLARIYYVSSNLAASPKRQKIIIGWKEQAPYFSLSTEEA